MGRVEQRLARRFARAATAPTESSRSGHGSSVQCVCSTHDRIAQMKHDSPQMMQVKRDLQLGCGG